MNDRPQQQWVKLWIDILADPTFMGWTPARRLCWLLTLPIAAQGTPPGTLTQSDGAPISIGAFARIVNVDWHTANDFMEAAIAAGMLARDSSNDTISVVNWNKRQRSNVASAVARSLGLPSDENRTNDGLSPRPLKGSRARQEEEQEAEVAVISEQGGPASRGRALPVSIYHLELVCQGLRGANDRTPSALTSVLAGMSEFELQRALEKTRRAHARNEAAYLVGTLKAMKVDRAVGKDSGDALANTLPLVNEEVAYGSTVRAA